MDLLHLFPAALLGDDAVTAWSDFLCTQITFVDMEFTAMLEWPNHFAH